MPNCNICSYRVTSKNTLLSRRVGFAQIMCTKFNETITIAKNMCMSEIVYINNQINRNK